VLVFPGWTVLATGTTGADGCWSAGRAAGGWAGVAAGRWEDGAVVPLPCGVDAADEEGTGAEDAVTGCQGDANPITLATTMTMMAATAAQE
jgi:hypothetical protein